MCGRFIDGVELPLGNRSRKRRSLNFADHSGAFRRAGLVQCGIHHLKSTELAQLGLVEHHFKVEIFVSLGRYNIKNRVVACGRNIQASGEIE